MKNVSESTSYRWKVSESTDLFSNPMKYLISRLKFPLSAVVEGKKLRDQRRCTVLPVALVCDVDQVSWIFETKLRLEITVTSVITVKL